MHFGLKSLARNVRLGILLKNTLVQIINNVLQLLLVYSINTTLYLATEDGLTKIRNMLCKLKAIVLFLRITSDFIG